MRRTLQFAREPTLAQAASVLNAIEGYLRSLGAHASRDAGGVRFRFTSPWHAEGFRTRGPLAIVSSGNVSVIASRGPRRVCYVLRFRYLIALCIGLTALTLAIWWPASRETLIGAAVAIWLLGYVVPMLTVAARFRRNIGDVAREATRGVLEVSG